MSDKVSRLFCAAACKAAERKVTLQYLLEKSQEFAAYFEGEFDDLLFVFYAEQFGQWFGPGMNKTPADCLAVAREQCTFAAQAWSELHESKPEPELSEAAQAALAARARAKAARAERVQREAEEAANAEATEAAEEALLNPANVSSTLISSLEIDGRAKSAYGRAGLTTVGDLQTYAAAKPLESIKGIGEDFALETSQAIEALVSGVN
jgi:hypothetical protein